MPGGPAPRRHPSPRGRAPGGAQGRLGCVGASRTCPPGKAWRTGAAHRGASGVGRERPDQEEIAGDGSSTPSPARPARDHRRGGPETHGRRDRSEARRLGRLMDHQTHRPAASGCRRRPRRPRSRLTRSCQPCSPPGVTAGRRCRRARRAGRSAPGRRPGGAGQGHGLGRYHPRGGATSRSADRAPRRRRSRRRGRRLPRRKVPRPPRQAAGMPRAAPRFATAGKKPRRRYPSGRLPPG